MFEAIYQSPWTATALVAAVNLIGLAAWLRRRTFLVAYLVLFAVASFADALRSGIWSPLHGIAAENDIGLLFVLLGDYRYFLLLERFAVRPNSGPSDRTATKAWFTTFGFMAVVPLIAYALMKGAQVTGRWSFLAWEAMFVVWALALRFFVYPRRLAAAPTAIRTWLFEITRLEVAIYALWVAADVIILLGADAGFALRIVPNVLYYGVFLWFVAFRAPPEVQR